MKKQVLLLLGAVVALLIGIGGVGTYLFVGFVGSSGSDEARDVIYEIRPGKSFAAVARDLQLAGVVKHAEAFSLYARFTGDRARMKTGEYLLSTSMTPREVLAVITSGRSVARPFTVSEGLNVFDIAELYGKAGFGPAEEFLRLARDPQLAKTLTGEPSAESLEGFLFPETYQITKFTTTQDLLTAMVRRFQSVWKEVEPQVRVKNLTKYQLLTLASIIEKETGAPEERPMIAAVFHNRMLKGMKLQTDPTIIYGMADESGIVPKNISRADILRPTKYNTYVINGLPPGPIANPGREALLAAGNPAVSEFLYFVSRNDGTHVFTPTYEEHLKAVRSFQLDPRAREGKSWRDLNKPPVQNPVSN